MVDHARGEAVVAIRALPDDGAAGAESEQVRVTLPATDHRPRSARGDEHGVDG